MRSFGKFAERLRDELQLEPSDEFVALVEGLTAGSAPRGDDDAPGKADEPDFRADANRVVDRAMKAVHDGDWKALRGLLTLDATKWQFQHGTRHPAAISPDNWLVIQPLLERPGNDDEPDIDPRRRRCGGHQHGAEAD